MNTGVQKSGATPEGAWTTTTPASAPRAGSEEGHRPDHGRARDPVRRHARARLGADAAGLPGEGDAGRRAARASGSCTSSAPARPAGATRPTSRPRSRGSPSSRGTSRSSRATTGTWKITFRPKHDVPVREFLATQGRFSPPLGRADRRRSRPTWTSAGSCSPRSSRTNLTPWSACGSTGGSGRRGSSGPGRG